MLTVGAILFIRSLVNLTNVDTGFNREGVLRLEVDSNLTGLKTDDPRMIAMFQQIGIKNLRVIDASIIPVIPDCRIQNSVYMVGEKGADMIKAAHRDLYK